MFYGHMLAMKIYLVILISVLNLRSFQIFMIRLIIVGITITYFSLPDQLKFCDDLLFILSNQSTSPFVWQMRN